MNNWFQSDECLEFYKSLGFVESFECHVCRNGEVKGRVVGYIQKDGGKIKQFLSRRAIINGGPYLADDITDAELSFLLKNVKETVGGKAIYIEIRNFEDYSLYKSAFEKTGWHYEPHYDFHIDTSSLDAIESKLGKSRKRDIRTSLRDGAEFGEAVSLQEVDDLYAILEQLYFKKVKTPLFPLAFFEKLYQSSWGKVFVVRFQGRIVGGTVCVCGDGVVYEWFACGEDGISKTVFPSTLATYAGIRYAAENRFQRFDMMGAGSPNDGGYGVRDFKSKFGGQLVEFGRFRYVANHFLYFVGALAIKIIKRR